MARAKQGPARQGAKDRRVWQVVVARRMAGRTLAKKNVVFGETNWGVKRREVPTKQILSTKQT